LTASTRWAWAALGALVVSCAVAGAGHTQGAATVVEIIHERAAAHGQSGARLERVARCESSLNPAAVGRAGELGLFQLHPRGELRTFYARGYSDPHNVWEAADFAATRFAEGGARAWSCR
jgi:hypothetical protein